MKHIKQFNTMIKIRDFSIGEEIKCLSDNNNDVGSVPFGIKENKTYIVEGFETCDNCGIEMVLLKDVDSGSSKECLCGETGLPRNAFYTKRFVSVNKQPHFYRNTDKPKKNIIKRPNIKKKEPSFFETKSKEITKKLTKDISKTTKQLKPVVENVYTSIKNTIINFFSVEVENDITEEEKTN